MVTGASSGIGFELARRFADDGYNMIVAADEDAIHACADKLAATGVDVMAVQGDLRKPDEVERLYRIATEGGRCLDAAALNAGVGRAGPFLEADLQEDLGIVDLDVRSTVHLASWCCKTWHRAESARSCSRPRSSPGCPAGIREMYNPSSRSCNRSPKPSTMSARNRGGGHLADARAHRDRLLPPCRHGRHGDRTDAQGRPERVAKQGYDAMMRGDRTVLAASLFSKAMGITNWFVPDSVKAAANRLIVAWTGSH